MKSPPLTCTCVCGCLSLTIQLTPPSLPFNFPMSLPPSLHPLIPPWSPPSSPVDHTDADGEQCTAGGPAGWGGGWPRGRGPRWRRRGWRPLASGGYERRNRRRNSGWVRARWGSPGALNALHGGPPLPSPPEGPPGFLHVRAWGSPWPQGPRPPSPGLPDSPPAAPQHTQRKLERPHPLNLPPSFLVALIGSLWPDLWVVIRSLSISFPLTLSPCISVPHPSL